MHKVDILVTSEIKGGLSTFQHGEMQIRFHRFESAQEIPLLEGSIWAFVDWQSTSMPGIEICRQIRCAPETSSARIVMILEDDDKNILRRALLAGADDYIVGPVDRNRLLDRILLRPSDLQDPSPLNLTVLGELKVDLAAFRATWAGKPIPLTPSELKLLRFFAQHPDRVFTRNQLIAALGKHERPLDPRTVDVWIGRLRRGLRKAGAGDLLRTVRSLGYVFDHP